MWNYDEQATTEGPQHVGPAPSQFTCERKSLAESTTGLEGLRERGSSRWKLEASGSERMTGFGFRNESVCSLDVIANRGLLHALLNFDTNNFCTSPAQNSSIGLRPSYPNKYPMAPFGGASGRFLTVSFDQPPLQTNMEYSVPGEAMNEASFIPFPVATQNGSYFNSENEVSKRHEHETSYQTEKVECKPNCSSSISKLQNGETGSSLFLSFENFNFSDEMQDTSSAFPDKTFDDGNMYSSSVCSYRDPDAAVPDIVKPDVYTSETSNATCDGSISCQTLPRDCNFDAQIGLPQTILDQFEQGNSEKLNGRVETL